MGNLSEYFINSMLSLSWLAFRSCPIQQSRQICCRFCCREGNSEKVWWDHLFHAVLCAPVHSKVYRLHACKRSILFHNYKLPEGISGLFCLRVLVSTIYSSWFFRRRPTAKIALPIPRWPPSLLYLNLKRMTDPPASPTYPVNQCKNSSYAQILSAKASKVLFNLALCCYWIVLLHFR